MKERMKNVSAIEQNNRDRFNKFTQNESALAQPNAKATFFPRDTAERAIAKPTCLAAQTNIILLSLDRLIDMNQYLII